MAPNGIYRVMVADDELPIVDWFRDAVCWEAHRMKLVGCISDGEEALRKISAEDPDIAILDIRMPGIDGLEVIERLAGTHPGMRFVIVSGHANFEFAKQAVQLNVARFLVKPLDEDDLMSALDAVVEELDARRREQLRVAAISHNLEALGPVAREHMLREWILAPEKWTAGEVQRRMNIDEFESRTVRILVCNISEMADPVVMLAVRQSCALWLPEVDTISSCFIGQAYVLLLRHITEEEVSPRIRAIHHEIYRATGRVINVAASETGRFDEIPRLYREALGKTPGHVLAEPKSMQSGTSIEESTVPPPRGKIDNRVWSIVQEIWHSRIAPSSTFQGDLAGKIAWQVALNIASPTLSLNWISRNVIFGNPDYLSKAFIRSTGMRFSDFVVWLRVEIAKVLIDTSPTLRLSEIANAVGYADNHHYFSVVFKRVTGEAPSDYRKKTRSGG